MIRHCLIQPLCRPRLPHYRLKHKLHSTTQLEGAFTPASQKRTPITNPTALQQYAKCDDAMLSAVEFFKRECASVERSAGVGGGAGAGRVTPDLLGPVRVHLPSSSSSSSSAAGVKLEEIATVGVREGSTLLVTLFNEHDIKHVESALYQSGIPGVVPHRLDNRTIKISIPKPTIESRKELFAATKRKAEDIRVQIRKHHSASLKKGRYDKHSIELEEFQKLTDQHIKQVDKLLADLQKAIGSK